MNHTPGENSVGRLTRDEVIQIAQALTAGLGAPPSEDQLGIILRWANLALTDQVMLAGALRGDFTITLRGNEPVFNITAQGIAALLAKSNSQNSASYQIREQTDGGWGGVKTWIPPRIGEITTTARSQASDCTGILETMKQMPE